MSWAMRFVAWMLFVFLAVLFVAAIALPPLGITSMPVVVVLSFAATAAIVAGWFLRHRRRSERFRRAHAACSQLLAEGKLAEADAGFAKIEREWLDRPVERAMIRSARAWIALRQGDLESALPRAVTAASRLRESTPEWRASSTMTLALAYALCGEADAARRTLDKAGELATYQPAVWLEAEMIARVRAGAPAEATRTYDEAYPRHERRISAASARELAVLNAFALSTANGPRDAGAIDAALRAHGAPRRGDYDWLAARWPELRAFLDAQGL